MWREITEDDIYGVLSQPEAAAYQTAAVAVGQDVLTDVTTKVIEQCRGYIADNPANTLAAGLTLPDRAILPALHLMRVELLTRLDMEVSKDRMDAKRDAIRFFERVSEGKVALESPDGETDDSGTSTRVETLNSRERIADRSKLSGL
jgi:hypothetical protein